jgi:hypothetical protein
MPWIVERWGGVSISREMRALRQARRRPRAVNNRVDDVRLRAAKLQSVRLKKTAGDNLRPFEMQIEETINSDSGPT